MAEQWTIEETQYGYAIVDGNRTVGIVDRREDAHRIVDALTTATAPEVRAAAGQEAELREVLETVADELTGVHWFLRTSGAAVTAEIVSNLSAKIEDALAAVDQDRGSPGEGSGPVTCDACGKPITEDYIEQLVEGDTNEYHVECAPPGPLMRTVLVDR